MYSPTLGRWMQEEPNRTNYVDGGNLYHAFDENPVDNLDPKGLDPKWEKASNWGPSSVSSTGTMNGGSPLWSIQLMFKFADSYWPNGIARNGTTVFDQLETAWTLTIGDSPGNGNPKGAGCPCADGSMPTYRFKQSIDRKFIVSGVTVVSNFGYDNINGAMPSSVGTPAQDKWRDGVTGGVVPWIGAHNEPRGLAIYDMNDTSTQSTNIRDTRGKIQNIGKADIQLIEIFTIDTYRSCGKDAPVKVDSFHFGFKIDGKWQPNRMVKDSKGKSMDLGPGYILTPYVDTSGGLTLAPD